MSPAIPLTGRQQVIQTLRAVVQRSPGSRARAASVPPLKDHTAQLKREDGKRYALITRGSAAVRIYGSPGRAASRGPYTIAWRQASFGKRLRAMRSNLARAISLAEEKATALANGETWRLSMTQRDWASYQRSLEILAPTGQPLELVAGIYTQCVQTLPKGVNLLDACRAYLERQRAGINPRNIPELAQDLLSSRKTIGHRGRPISDRWAHTLDKQLGRFAKRFQCPLDQVTGNDLDAWLNGLGSGSRTRTNYRGAVMALVRFAKFKRALPEDWHEFDRVAYLKPEDAEIKILAPAQLARLLAVAPRSLKPLIYLCAFAGIRHEEIAGKKKRLLEWTDIRRKAGYILVPRAASKNASAHNAKDRKVPITPNLAAWLEAWSGSAGLVCKLKNSSNALTRAKRKAGIPCGRNETRNTLRKTFITCRKAIIHNIAQVAEEAGTSVAKIRSNYDAVDVEESQAEAWFDIWPTPADVIQLDFGNGFGTGRRVRKAS